MPHNHDRGPGLPELLAPAGSPEALAAAVSAGADAVYLAGRRFGARQYAANFSEEELVSAIDYAHLRGVRVYVTVNVLARESELPDLARYLYRLYEIGADAVLVQDLGVAAVAREIVPGLPLHASTQMTIHNREGVAWAAEEGFSRVVLARELTLPEIEDISADPRAEGVGLEVFAHGALCYSYSGQCLLSSVIGGRSGNRGMCAQPCRKPYRLVTAGVDEYGRPGEPQPLPVNERYLLSTRDLCVYPYLDRLVQAPVASLKIEGRMRSPAYVATVTRIYRRALDAIAAGDDWSPLREDLRDLALAFNREFTEGYILGAHDLMGRDRPGNRGVMLGRVTGYDPLRGEATVRLTGDIVPGSGDGVVFWGEDPGMDVGAVIRGAPAVRNGTLRLSVPAPVRPGARVFLTRSMDLEERAKRIMDASPEPLQLDLLVTWDGETPCLEAIVEPIGGEPLRVRYRSALRMEPARNRPLTEEQIAEQFGKTGGTQFVIRNIDIRYPGGLFAPLGELNRVRRAFLERVEETLLAARRPDAGAVNAARQRLETALAGIGRVALLGREPRPLQVSVYTDTLDGVEAALGGGARTLYLEVAAVPYLLKEAARVCREGGAEVVWKWPAITRRSFLDTATSILPSLYGAGVRGVMVSGMGAADAVRRAEPRMSIYGAAGLNLWNHRAAARLEGLFRRCTASPELPADDLAGLAASTGVTLELEVLVQGNIEAMASEDRLLANVGGEAIDISGFVGLQDGRNRVFPLRCDCEGRTYISNAVETCLIDHIPEIAGMGIDSVAIDARGRGPRYAGEMARLYRIAVAAVARGDSGILPGLRDEVKRRALGGITGGHFVRGIEG